MVDFDAVISFCSYDEHVINDSIAGVRGLAKNIFVVYHNKLLNGTEENLDIINIVKSNNLDCKFIELEYKSNQSARWHHNNARWIGTQLSRTPYIMYLDADEVFDNEKLAKFLETKTNDNMPDFMQFACYWYFRSKKYRAKTLEDCVTLLKKGLANKKELMFTESERHIYKYIDCGSKELMVMNKNEPFCHHYSWALTKEKMLNKVRSWGHRNDKNWERLIEEEFSRNFNGTDFVHGYSYEVIE